jgi:hypothetical protein
MYYKLKFPTMVHAKEQKAKSREERAESRDQRAESRDQRGETRDQRAEARDQRPETRHTQIYSNTRTDTHTQVPTAPGGGGRQGLNLVPN